MMLLRQQIKSESVSLALWCLAIAALDIYSVVMWDMLRESGGLAEVHALLAELPETVKAMFGGEASLADVDGVLRSATYGSWIGIPFTIFTGTFVAGMVSREMDRRTMEFLLALPVARWQVLLQRWAGLVLALALLHAVHAGAVLGTVAAIGEQVAAGPYLVAGTNSLLLYVAVGGLMLLTSLFLDDYVRGISGVLGLGLGLLFVHVSTASATGLVQDLRRLLPHHYFHAGQIFRTGEVPGFDLAVLGGVGLAALLVSLLVFQRKQIAV